MSHLQEKKPIKYFHNKIQAFYLKKTKQKDLSALVTGAFVNIYITVKHNVVTYVVWSFSALRIHVFF